jgi:hypothetical protein
MILQKYKKKVLEIQSGTDPDALGCLNFSTHHSANISSHSRLSPSSDLENHQAYAIIGAIL